jgi:hypothetical protein
MAALLPIIGSLVGIGSAGAGIATALSSKPAAPTNTPPIFPSLTQNQMTQAQQAVGGSAANAQASTGQGLSPSAQAALVDQLYGTPG